jgi:hypothetical protein
MQLEQNIKIGQDELQKALTAAERGVSQYLEIMSRFQAKEGAALDPAFQRKYKSFYGVRQRSQHWYETYFSFLESKRNSQVSFGETIRYLHQKLGRCEFSFSSKLVATINPDMPIWDKYVLKHLEITKPPYKCADRLKRGEEAYDAICEWYSGFVGSQQGLDLLKAFDQRFPSASITPTKKIDFVLWQLRGSRKGEGRG